MAQTRIKINEELCNYMYLLSLNISSRKDLLDTFLPEKGVNNASVKAYLDEYYIYDAKAKMIQNQITTSVKSADTNVINWELDYVTAIMTLTHNDNVEINTQKIANAIHNNIIDIDEAVAEKLCDLYETPFNDETGIVTDSSCGCVSGKGCDCTKEIDPTLQPTDDADVIKLTESK